MITVRASARKLVYASDDIITSGSVGIPVKFTLSEDFDGLSVVAVFDGSGASVDVALLDGTTCVVPHEVLTTAGGYLRIGIYASNSEGTIVIPTVWAGSKLIVPGTIPSEADPVTPTPSWPAQVQQAAAEALSIARDIQARADAGDFDGAPGPQGETGPRGPGVEVSVSGTGIVFVSRE